SFLIGDVEPDDETWSSTDGEFAVELQLDEPEVDDLLNITSMLQGDLSGHISAATSSAGAGEDLAYDGLTSTHWAAGAATGWIQYDFGSGVTKTVQRYRLASAATDPDQDPMNWTLQGSNN